MGLVCCFSRGPSGRAAMPLKAKNRRRESTDAQSPTQGQTPPDEHLDATASEINEPVSDSLDRLHAPRSSDPVR